MAESRKTLDIIASESCHFGADDIAIGVPDSEVAPYLIVDLAGKGITAFDRSGEKVGEHPVFTLLEAFFKLNSERKYTDFAGFLRHPDILDLLKTDLRISPYKLLEELDKFQNQYLPTSFNDVVNRLLEITSSQTRMTRDFDNLMKGVEFTRHLIDSFFAAKAEKGIRTFLKRVYNTKNLNREKDEDARFMAAAEEIGAALNELGEMPDSRIKIERNELFQLLLNILRDHRYYHDVSKSAIDLEGWLELFWENAPFLLVTGTNEGSIPTRKIFDAFLPDSLRRKLGLKGNDDICARDAYIMADLIESRRQAGRTVFILAKLSQDGEPLKPSRLLFHCPDAELTQRAKKLFAETPSIKQNYPGTVSFPLDVKLPRDTPIEVLSLKQMSVTMFKSYLACPFRFYLAEVLGMEELSDEKVEMDALDFGTIIHHALQRMAENADMKKCQDEKKLRDYLYGELAAEKAWDNCLRKMTPFQRANLIACAQAVNKTPKTLTAKARAKWLREAQKAMDNCRGAIPAWIMPLYRVFETIPPAPECFDVVIIDEASQTGPEGLVLQYLAKQVIVVGDDQQISPDAIGVLQAQINTLVERYLDGIPFKGFYIPQTSLFDFAAILFGGKIVLREHFRCMPEIIQFSNQLCYTGTPLKPLRQYPPKRLEPILLRYVKDGFREGPSGHVLNKPEADELVETIAKMCSLKEYAGKTMGVISLLGDAQAKYIENKLLTRLSPADLEKRRIVCGDAYAFQGDERDVILLSMVDAPNESGRALAGEADKRRFNVAASRAKDQVVLFHTATLNDLHPECMWGRMSIVDTKPLNLPTLRHSIFVYRLPGTGTPV